MDVIECIKTRRSIRKYTDKEISNELLEEIVEASRMAPTWKNSQTVRYVVVKDRAVLDKICKEALLGFEHNAGIISGCQALVVLTQINGRCGYEKDGSFTTSKGAGWEMFDAGVAAQTFCLAAHDKGVGSVILGIFDDKKVAEAIELEEGKSVAALISIGYPEAVPDATPRKDVAEYLKIM